MTFVHMKNILNHPEHVLSFDWTLGNKVVLTSLEKAMTIASTLLLNITFVKLVSKVDPITSQQIYRLAIRSVAVLGWSFMTFKVVQTYFQARHLALKDKERQAQLLKFAKEGSLFAFDKVLNSLSTKEYSSLINNKDFMLKAIEADARVIDYVPANVDESFYLDAIQVNSAVVLYMKQEQLYDDFKLRACALNNDVKKYVGDIKPSTIVLQLPFALCSLVQRCLYLDEILKTIVLNKEWYRKSHEWSSMQIMLAQPAQIPQKQYRVNNFLDRAIKAKEAFDSIVKAKQQLDKVHPGVKQAENEKLVSLDLTPYAWVFSQTPQVNQLKYFRAFRGIEELKLSIATSQTESCITLLKMLENLKGLRLSFAGSGLIPAHTAYKGLGELLNLTYLRLPDHFDERAMQYLIPLKNLTDLKFRDLNLISEKISHLEKLPLQRLSLTNNWFGFMPVLKDLVFLNLKFCVALNDTGTKNFSELKKLTCINLTSTKIGDKTIERLATLTDLTTLKLSDSRITHEAFQCLSSLSSLTRLEASECTNFNRISISTSDRSEIEFFRPFSF